MASDRVVIELSQTARNGGDGPQPLEGSARGDHAMASAFAIRHGRAYRYVASRWISDSTGNVLTRMRKIALPARSGTNDDHSAASASHVSGDAAAGRESSVWA